MNDKFVCVTLNVITLLLSLNGLGLIAMGILLILVYLGDYFYLSAFLYSLSIGYTLFGAVLIALAVTGSVAVIRKHFVLEGFYIFSLMVLLAVIVIAAVVTIVFDRRGKFEDYVDRNLNNSIMVLEIFIIIKITQFNY